jgi:hypothetical protein
MSDDKKTEKTTTAAPKAAPNLELPRGIPVKMMRLVRPTQVPGHPQTDVVQAVKQPNGQQWEIEYVPQMRHHRITFTNPNESDDTKKVRTAFVHETHVSVWEPQAL